MDFKPTKLGKYVLLERLAMGGMAEVYRAKASGAGGFEKQLAIKRILPNYSENDEFRRMFEYEARLSSMLTHANIVQIYDFVKFQGTYLLSMEYVDGKNLRQFINKVKKLGYQLPIEYGAFLVNEVCKGLEYAHKKRDDVTGRPLNIIHRDMSPQNVMLSYDGAVKIVDFGIAKAKDRVDETRSGVIKGKFGYMSPEQANGEPVDHRTDIFSTGIILYELLTGRRLFTADNDMATLKMIQECVIPPPTKFNPKIPPELEKIVLKALTKDLNLRFQSAGALNRQLQEFLAKYYASFGQKDLSEAFQKVFKDEIAQEKRRFEQAYRQSIPFSQGASGEEDGSESEASGEVEGSITNGEQQEKTAITSSGMSSVDDSEPSAAPSSMGDKTVVSGSFELTGPSEPGQISTKIKESAAPAKEFELESNSLSTMGNEVSWNVKNTGTEGEPETNERTVVEEDSLLSEKVTPTEANTEPRTATPNKQSDDKYSGIDLELNTKETNNRERSISLVNQMSRTGNEPKAPTNLTFDPPTPVARRAKVDRAPDYYPDEDFSEPRSSGWGAVVRSVVSLSLLGVVVVLTVSLYRSYLSGEVPTFIRTALGLKNTPTPTKKFPSNTASVPDPDSTPERKVTQDCSLKVESDPAGAKIFIGSEERGTTPTSIPLECGSNHNVTLRKDGYEGVSENLVVRKSGQAVFKTMKKIPVGTLAFRLDLNATVKIEEIKYERYVKLNEPVEITLPANRKVKIHFVNAVYGLDVVQEVFVLENERSEKAFKLTN